MKLTVLILLLLLLTSCAPQTDLSQTDAVPGNLSNNPIDDAFVRLAKENEGEALGDNPRFMYLYALKWHDEYYNLVHQLDQMAVPDADAPDSFYRNDADFRRMLPRGAYGYALKFSASQNAHAIFTELARFYKILSYDCLSRSPSLLWTTNRDELQQSLADADYHAYIPDDMNRYLRYDYGETRHPMPIFAALPDKDIYFSMAPPFGAVLSVQGTDYFYGWESFLTPRGILPRISLSDYDGDGMEEIAVILYVGSGTGVSVEKLYIVEQDGDRRDFAISAEMIAQLLYHRLSAKYDPDADMVTVRLDEQEVGIDASRVPKERRRSFDGLQMEDIVSFSTDNNILQTHISIGLTGFDVAPPFDYVELYADLVYQESGLSLSNVNILYENR